jgi:hypothetical protein
MARKAAPIFAFAGTTVRIVIYVIYTAGQRFASSVAAKPPQFYEHGFAINFTYSWRP